MNVCPPRFATPRNPARQTIGPEICDVMRGLGYQPMPWQIQVLDVAGELDPDGSLHYKQCIVTVPRQSGKTSLLLALHVDRQLHSAKRGWAGMLPEQTVHEAQHASDARDKLVHEWHPVIYGSQLSGFLDPNTRNHDGLMKSNGKESLCWVGGGRTITAPPSRTGAHGLSRVGLVTLDEAFGVTEDAEAGARPAMLVHPSRQLCVFSTAGTAESVYLWGKVEDGRARSLSAADGSVAYFEWSAPEDADPTDPAVWAATHPAIGYTITLQTLQDEFDSMDIDLFRRSYLNQWTASQSRIIPAKPWQNCLDATSTISGRVWLAVDASPERWASVSVGGWNTHGVPHVEVIKHSPSLDWVADACYTLTRKHRVNALMVDNAGPIGSVIPDIRSKANTKIEVVDARTMAAACGRFLSDVMETNLRHIGQDSLNNAVEAAAKRQLLDSWAFSRRHATADISPLVGCTLANWATVTHPVRELQRIH